MRSTNFAMVAVLLFTCACATDPENDGEDGVDSDAVTAQIGQQVLLFDKTNWGTAGTTYDHNFFDAASTDTPIEGWRTVKKDSSTGKTYEEQFISASTGWGDLSVIHPHVVAKPGQWWKNEIHGMVGPEASIYVEGKIYFVNANGKVLYECVNVTTSKTWAVGGLEVWNKGPGVVPEINTANNSCKAPPGTVVLWMHIKTTAKKSGQTGAGYVDSWRVGRCADNGDCDLR